MHITIHLPNDALCASNTWDFLQLSLAAHGGLVPSITTNARFAGVQLAYEMAQHPHVSHTQLPILPVISRVITILNVM